MTANNINLFIHIWQDEKLEMTFFLKKDFLFFSPHTLPKNLLQHIVFDITNYKYLIQYVLY